MRRRLFGRVVAGAVATIALVTTGLLVLTGDPAEAAVTRTITWPSGWRSPLASSTVSITTNYGAFDLGCPNANRTHGYTWYLPSGRTEHLGLDIAAADTADVFAIGDGRVMAAGALWGAGSKGVVLVEHMATSGQRFTAAYGHIVVGKSPITKTTWRAGDVVRRGNKLGDVTLAGTGTHLHFGIEPGAQTYVDPTAESGGTGNCTHQAKGTTNPESYLAARTHAPLAGSIVGWKNTNGTVTSWRVTSVSGALRRYWIPSTAVYNCVRRAGVDRGPMPARFLDQLPDRTGYHATC